MSMTKIDTKTALLVVDLQQGIVSLETCHPSQQIVTKCCQLMTTFRQLSMPIILINVDGNASGRTEQIRGTTSKSENWSKLVEQISVHSSDILVTKKTWGAFSNTHLQQILKSQQITQLVICGIATSMGVESTARQAFELGYNVTLPIDAMTDIDLSVHQNSVQKIFPKLGETGTTQDLLEILLACK